MDWKGMLDLDVMSLSNTSGISTLSSKCRFKGTVSWVAPVVVSQWLERRQETGKVPQGACDKKKSTAPVTDGFMWKRVTRATRMRVETNLLRAVPIEVPQHKFGHWTVTIRLST